MLQELAEPRRDLLVLERVTSAQLDVPLEQVGTAIVGIEALRDVCTEVEHDRPQLLDRLADVSRRRDGVVLAGCRDRVEQGSLLREHNLRLVAKVAEERRPAHLRPGGDVAHRHVVEATLREELVRSFDDALPRTLLLALDEGVVLRAGACGSVCHPLILQPKGLGPYWYAVCYGTAYHFRQCGAGMLTIEDRHHIAETLALHAYVFDENQLDRLDELFLPDAVYDMSAAGMGVFNGVEAIGSAAARMSASGLAPRAHFVTNVIATETGEGTASVRSKGLMIMHDGAIRAALHDDILCQHGGRWLISRRLVTPVEA